MVKNLRLLFFWRYYLLRSPALLRLAPLHQAIYID